MNINEPEELRQEAFNGNSKHCQDCDFNFSNPERDDEPPSDDCTCTDPYQCPAVAAVYGALSDLTESQQFDYDHLETALQKVTDDIVHFADHNNTEGILKSVKDALRDARFEQAKENQLI